MYDILDAGVIAAGKAMNDKKRGPGGVTRVMHAASMDDPEALLRAIRAHPDEIDAQDDEGWTALHYAIRLRDNILILLDEGANPRIKNKAGQDPSDLAAQKGHVENAVHLEKAKKEIRPEDMPGRILQLENEIEDLKKTIAALIARIEKIEPAAPNKKDIKPKSGP